MITTPFSFIASANCLLYERVRPVFADIEPDTLNLDVAKAAAAITPRTKAILAVDVFGRPAAWEELHALARERKLALIEDSCEALGARYRRGDGRWVKAGALGEAGCFAFYPNKQITTGEGGMIVTDRDDLASRCRSLRNQGREEGASWLQHAQVGYNYRLSDVNCALGLVQMQRVDEILATRAAGGGMVLGSAFRADRDRTAAGAPGRGDQLVCLCGALHGLHQLRRTRRDPARAARARGGLQ